MLVILIGRPFMRAGPHKAVVDGAGSLSLLAFLREVITKETVDFQPLISPRPTAGGRRAAGDRRSQPPYVNIPSVSNRLPSTCSDLR